MNGHCTGPHLIYRIRLPIVVVSQRRALGARCKYVSEYSTDKFLAKRHSSAKGNGCYPLPYSSTVPPSPGPPPLPIHPGAAPIPTSTPPLPHPKKFTPLIAAVHRIQRVIYGYGQQRINSASCHNTCDRSDNQLSLLRERSRHFLGPAIF